MQLMGDFASANHDVIHGEVLKFVGARCLATVENHHNFAWKENYNGKELVIHRKGATPAAEGVRGFIPGTMIDPGYLVEGLGSQEAYRSSSHGAGRVMSRRAARQTTTRSALNKRLQEAGVTLLTSGLDESPHAYKSIEEVMHAQRDLVRIIGKFSPRFVKMAPDGEKPED
jgi:tRNA-splicing ligase RtcB (3'-phosphate/5'-hydroxy nucleic acid ligase)